ncbi:MAG: hypothetical protein WD651_04450 [Acidimicrobiia bacterium]
MKDESESNSLEELLKTGAEVAGATAGAAIGLVGGPAGVLAGAASGPLVGRALLHVAQELRSRFLGHREEVRIGATLAYAIDTIESRRAQGERLREDGFFDSDSQSRNDAEEVVEATLLAAQREPQEKKLKYLGRLLGNLAFEESIDRSQANLLIRMAEQLSYRQLLLLQLFLQPGSVTRDNDFRGQGAQLSNDLVYVLAEIHDLYLRGLVNNGGEVAFGLTGLIPARVETQGIGRHLIVLMGLNTVEDAPALNTLTALLMSGPKKTESRER